MNEKALHTLEYDKIIEKLVGYAAVSYTHLTLPTKSSV